MQRSAISAISRRARTGWETRTQLAEAVDRLDEVAEVVEGHGAPSRILSVVLRGVTLSEATGARLGAWLLRSAQDDSGVEARRRRASPRAARTRRPGRVDTSPRRIPAPPAGAPARAGSGTPGSTLVTRYRRSYVSRSVDRSRAAPAGSRTGTAGGARAAAAGSFPGSPSGAPGLSTRAASASPASRSTRFRTPQPTIAPSNEASGNGSSSASPSTGATRAALSRPSRSMAGTKSAPTIRPRKSGPPGQRGREVERAGAEVEVDSVRLPLPPQPPHRVSPPALIEAEADDAVEAVVGGRDGGEDVADVGPLLGPARDG